MTTASPANAVSPGTRLVSGQLHRVQHGHGKAFVETPPPPPSAPVRRPARVAVMLALACKIQDAIDRGVVRDRAEVARLLGITRARVTQLLDINLLAPDIRERVLDLETMDGGEPITERAVREVARKQSWAEQRAAWQSKKA